MEKKKVSGGGRLGWIWALWNLGERLEHWRPEWSTFLKRLVRNNSKDRGAWWAKSMGLQRAGHNWATNTWLLLSSFTFIKRLFSSSSLSTVTVVSSAHLRLLTVLLAILIPAYSNSMIYKINKVWHLYCPTKRKILLGLDSTLYLNNGEILFYYSA